MNGFLITFNPISHGWTDARISFEDGASYDFVASNVPNDAIGDTVGALTSIAVGCVNEQRVAWSLEPGFVTLTFQRDGDELVLDFATPSGATKTVRAPASHLLMDHWRSFRRLSTHESWADPTVWPPGFPERDVGLLGQQLGR